MSILRLSSWAAKLDISHRSKLGHLAPPQSLTLANTIDFTELIVWQGISGKTILGTYQRAPCPHRRKQNRHWCFPSVQKHSNPGWLKYSTLLPVSPTNWHIYIYIPTFDLAYIIAIYNITHVLTFDLTYVLAFHLTHTQTLYSYIYISFYLTFSLTSYLAFYLTFYLKISYIHSDISSGTWSDIFLAFYHSDVFSGMLSDSLIHHQDSIFCSGPASFRESSRR